MKTTTTINQTKADAMRDLIKRTWTAAALGFDQSQFIQDQDDLIVLLSTDVRLQED